MPVSNQRVGRNAENIAAASVANDQIQTIPQCCQELRIVHTTKWQIWQKDHGLHPLQNNLTQELKLVGHTAH